MSRDLSFGEIVWIRPYRRRYLSRHKTLASWKCCKDADDDDYCPCVVLHCFLKWLLTTYRDPMPEEERHALRFCIVQCDFLLGRLFSGIRSIRSFWDSNLANHPAWFLFMQQSLLHDYESETDPEDREMYKTSSKPLIAVSRRLPSRVLLLSQMFLFCRSPVVGAVFF